MQYHCTAEYALKGPYKIREILNETERGTSRSFLPNKVGKYNIESASSNYTAKNAKRNDLQQIPERRQKSKQNEQLSAQRQAVMLVAMKCIS